MSGLKIHKPWLSFCTLWLQHPQQTRLESTSENMDRVKSLFSASWWCAKASPISQRLSKHFFKGYLDISHWVEELVPFLWGHCPHADLNNTWIVRKGSYDPASPPEHRDVWLNWGLCNSHSPPAGGAPGQGSMWWVLQAAGQSRPIRAQCFSGSGHTVASVELLSEALPPGLPDAVCHHPGA